MGAGVGVGVGVGVNVVVVGNTVAVPKGRVAKDATPVAGVAGVAVAPAVATIEEGVEGEGGGVDTEPICGIVKEINGVTAVTIGISEGIGVVGIPVNEGTNANCADVGSGGGVGIAIDGVVKGISVGVETGVGTGAVDNTVAVAKGRVPKDAPPVTGKGTVAPVANGVVDSALPLRSFPNNCINTVLSSDSPNVSLDFCNLGIVFCT